MVLHREIDAGVGGMMTQRFPGEAHLVFILDGDFLDRGRPHLMPLMVRVYLIADDPAPDASIRGVDRRPSSSDEIREGLIASAAFRCDRVGGHRRAFHRIGLGVSRKSADAFVGRAIGDDDECQYDALIAQGFDLSIHRPDVTFVEREDESIRRGRELAGFGFLLGGEQAAEIEIDTRVVDAELEHVGNHLDLDALGAGGCRVGCRIRFGERH